ncbi:MAG: hypothetical protein G3M78_04840 [Candidatus Nitrohelix vancouverensis]|uniref:HAMP domain-containing protein n=1 Tax=Candidatus Nitrohelix vancouverensis TaxID=2705534 RepID=A0A7T0C544_9BACT|nr:MAG: hypothetical protein G3M78_04840 [Candidatus Nitrohelix vancouverensis]
MTGYIVSISCLGYMAFFLFVQLGQVDRIVQTINPESMTAEQMTVLKNRVTRSTEQLKDEMLGVAIVGSLVSIIGAAYTFSLIIRPLNRMIEYASLQSEIDPPEFNSNTELKQLTTAITELREQLKEKSSVQV